MATIGHSLVGLSLAGCSRAASRGNALRYVWPGLMILLAHLVDLIELAGVWLTAGSLDPHFLTHSRWSALILIVAVIAAVRLLTRLRKPWPYALIIIVILSHLLLDARIGRGALASLYGITVHEATPTQFFKTVEAEIWAYGLLLILVLLVRAARQKSCPPLGRRTCVILGVAGICSAITRMPLIWAPVYAASGLHAGLLLRREFTFKFLWSAVPLIPLVAYIASEIYRSNLAQRGEACRIAGQFKEAIPYFERSAAFCTRDSKMWLDIHLGQCYLETQNLRAADEHLRSAADNNPTPNWGQFWLAWFYGNPRVNGTPYYRPAEAVRLLEMIIAKERSGEMRETAEQLLGRISPAPGS